MARIKGTRPHFNPVITKLWLEALRSKRFLHTNRCLKAIVPGDIRFHHSAVGVLAEIAIETNILKGIEWEALHPRLCAYYEKPEIHMWGLPRDKNGDNISAYYLPAPLVDVITSYKEADGAPNQQSANAIFLNSLSDYDYQKKRSFRTIAKYIESHVTL